MTAPVASPSMNVPNTGATAGGKTAAQAPSGGTFGDLLTALAQVSDANAADGAGTPAPQNDPTEAAAAAAAALELAAAASLSASQAPRTAQLDSNLVLPEPLTGDQGAKPAAPRSRKTPSADQTPAGLPQTDPAAALNAALALASPPMPGAQVAGNAKPPDAIPAVPQTTPSVDSPSPSGKATATPAGSDPNAPPPTQSAPGAQEQDEAPTVDAKAPSPALPALPERLAPAHVSDSATDQNAGDAQNSQPSPSLDTSQNGNGNLPAAPDHGAAIALDAALAKTIQLPAAASGATPPQPPVGPDARTAATSARTGAQRSAADQSSDKAKGGASAHPDAPADTGLGLATADSTSGEAEKRPDSGERGGKGAALSVLPDDTSRSAASGAHGGSPAVAATPLANVPSFNFVNHTGVDGTGSQLPAAIHGGAADNLGAPVKLGFAAPGALADTSSGLDALALRIAAHSADGERNFSIRLDPPELGRVEVNLNVNAQGHAEAELSADRPQTLDLLQKDASSLERALKDAGLILAGGLAFSLKGDGRSGAWRDSQGSQRGRALQIAAVDAAHANAAIAGGAGSAAHAYGFSTARLDIRV